MNLTGLSGAAYRLANTPIGSGGEGDIFPVLGDGGRVAKIYKAGVVSRELEEKLKIMTLNPPNKSVLSQVAWPLDVVYDSSGKCAGFVMPRLSINAELGDVYKYPPKLSLSAQLKVNIAQNICVVISEVHRAGYVFGDFNPRNIGLDTSTGLVSFLDTDTYHVADKKTGGMYRCNVCAPGYAAPELLQKCSDYAVEKPSASKNAYAETPLPTFTQETDNFALAIHVFKLLMNGYTPFGGIIETDSVSQSSPGVGDSAVRRDSYCFKPGFKHQSAAILPLEAFPQEIADLFTRAFIVGKFDPKQRPNAREWHGALTAYYQTLVTCRGNPLHQYDRKNVFCPYCEADKRFAEAIGETRKEAPLLQTKYLPPVAIAGMPTSGPSTQLQSKPPPAPTKIRNYPTQSQVGSAPFAKLTHENPQPQIMDRKLLKAVGKLPLLVLILGCVILAFTIVGIYRINRINFETSYMLYFPLARYNLLSYAEVEIVNLHRLTATMPLYAGEPELLDSMLREALDVGMSLHRHIDVWIFFIDVDERVDPAIRQENLNRMAYVKELIDHYLEEVTHAMEYHVRNYDRNAQKEVFTRGGEIIGVLKGIFDLTQMAAQADLFNAQYGIWFQFNRSDQIMIGIFAIGIVLWTAILLFANGKLKKLKLIDQTVDSTLISKIKKIFWLSFGLLSVIAAIIVYLNFQAHISHIITYFEMENHTARNSTINNLNTEFNDIRRLGALMAFYVGDEASLQWIDGSTSAIQSEINWLLFLHISNLHLDWLASTMNPEFQRLSLETAEALAEYFRQYNDVIERIFSAALVNNREELMELFESSVPLVHQIENELSFLAAVESIAEDETWFQMQVTTYFATWQHIFLAILSIILGAITARLLSKTISKSINASKNLKSSATP